MLEWKGASKKSRRKKGGKRPKVRKASTKGPRELQTADLKKRLQKEEKSKKKKGRGNAYRRGLGVAQIFPNARWKGYSKEAAKKKKN